MLVSFLAYFTALKMVAICSFETSVGFQQVTRRYIAEDRTLHNHCCENLKYYLVIEVRFGFAIDIARQINEMKSGKK
jgi:hypothetical protein